MPPGPLPAATDLVIIHCCPCRAKHRRNRDSYQIVILRRYVSAAYTVALSAIMSASLLKVGVPPKRLNVGWRKQRRTIAHDSVVL